MKRELNVKEGDIFCIPLYLKEEDWNKKFCRQKVFDPNLLYAFGRIISIESSGDLIEVFNCVGNLLNLNKENIINSGRIFHPVSVMGGSFLVCRWRVLFSDDKYNKYNDSEYDNIYRIYGGYGMFKLKKGNKTIGDISDEEAQNHIGWHGWTVWRGHHLENRVKKIKSIE